MFLVQAPRSSTLIDELFPLIKDINSSVSSEVSSETASVQSVRVSEEDQPTVSNLPGYTAEVPAKVANAGEKSGDYAPGTTWVFEDDGSGVPTNAKTETANDDGEDVEIFAGFSTGERLPGT